MQDSLVAKAFMVYSDNKLFQGYYIFAKFKQHKITNFDGIKLIAQKQLYAVTIFAKTD